MSALSVALSCMAHDFGMAVYTAPMKVNLDIQKAKYEHKVKKEAKKAEKETEKAANEAEAADQKSITVRKTAKEVNKSKDEVFKEAEKEAPSDFLISRILSSITTFRRSIL